MFLVQSRGSDIHIEKKRGAIMAERSFRRSSGESNKGKSKGNGGQHQTQQFRIQWDKVDELDLVTLWPGSYAIVMCGSKYTLTASCEVAPYGNDHVTGLAVTTDTRIARRSGSPDETLVVRNIAVDKPLVYDTKHDVKTDYESVVTTTNVKSITVVRRVRVQE